MRFENMLNAEEMTRVQELIEQNNQERNKSIKNVTTKALNNLNEKDFFSYNDMIIELITNDKLLGRTTKKMAYNIAYGYDFLEQDDIYNNLVLYVLNGFTLSEKKEGKILFTMEEKNNNSKFNDFRFFSKGLRFSMMDIVETEKRRKQKFSRTYSKDGKMLIEKMGYTTFMNDKVETLADMQAMLTDAEYQVFTLYVQGYKVRDIESMVKNGRRVYDSMKKIVKEYYNEFYEYITRYMEPLEQ